MTELDRLFVENHPSHGEFTFDQNVARVFDDMISRSVPLYEDVQRAVPVLCKLLLHQSVKVIDLGCSTGTTLIHLAKSWPNKQLELYGVDNSAAMLAKCHEKLVQHRLEDLVQTFHADICEFEFPDASAVLMNYTLQFVDVDKRKSLLTRICSSLRPGGFLLVSEKVAHAKPQMDDALVELYFEYKRRQGYSELEISRKRDALENVLVPLTISENECLFREAGFERIEIMLKWFNFATFVCYPDESN